MFLKDEDALGFLALAILLIFPALGIALEFWGFIWVALLSAAVLLAGRKIGLERTAILSLLGYLVPFLIYGTEAIELLSLVPLAGLITLWGWRQNWRGNVTFFWSAVGVVVLAIVLALPFMAQGSAALPVDEMAELALQEYRSSDTVALWQQQGLSEAQLRELLQKTMGMFTLILPGFAALLSLISFGFAVLVTERFLPRSEKRVPFIHWRLPWYAVWGIIIGLGFYLAGDQFSWTLMRSAGINILVIYGGVTFVLGFAVCACMLQSSAMPGWLKIMAVLAGVFFIYLTAIGLIMCGLLDLVVNIRRLPEEA